MELLEIKRYLKKQGKNTLKQQQQQKNLHTGKFSTEFKEYSLLAHPDTIL